MTEVLQIVTSTDRRGAELFGADLGRALERRGRRVRTVALAPGRHGGGLDVPVLGDKRLGLRTLRALRQETRRVRLVVAHGSTTLPACVAATAATGVPFVYRNIGDPAHWGRSHARRVRSWLLLGRARAVVALAAATAEDLTRRYRVDPAKVRVIPKGVPSERFPPPEPADRQRARDGFGLPAGSAVVLYLGALSPEKDVGLAIEAVGLLPDARLLVVGDGPERAQLEGIADRRAPGRVRFTGPVHDPVPALAAADALVLPSRSEGLPGVLIEAGFSRVPVVATDVGFVREIVVDGETGRLVPPGDPEAIAAALATVLRAPGALGGAARARCLERFDIGVVAAEWDALIDELTTTVRGHR